MSERAHNVGPGGCVPWEEAIQLRNALEHIAMNMRGKKHLTQMECRLVRDLAQAAVDDIQGPLKAAPTEALKEWVEARDFYRSVDPDDLATIHDAVQGLKVAEQRAREVLAACTGPPCVSKRSDWG